MEASGVQMRSRVTLITFLLNLSFCQCHRPINYGLFGGHSVSEIKWIDNSQGTVLKISVESGNLRRVAGKDSSVFPELRSQAPVFDFPVYTVMRNKVKP
jgi:hypothetical protein